MIENRPSASGTAFICLLLAVSVLGLLAPACTPQPFSVTREPTTLHLAVAGSCADAVQDVASAYESAHPWVTVTSGVLNNAMAASALQEGQADLALLSWGSVDEGEHRLWMEPFARDGVAVIAHPASSFPGVELAELREIFRGRLQEREGAVLTAVSREDGSGTRAAFESMVLDGEGTTLNAVVVPSSEAMIAYVARTPGAIGYVSTRCLDERVRVLPVGGVPPTEETISDGSYPLWRELQLASNGEPTGEARQFAQWLLRGSRATDLMQGASTIPVTLPTVLPAVESEAARGRTFGSVLTAYDWRIPNQSLTIDSGRSNDGS